MLNCLLTQYEVVVAYEGWLLMGGSWLAGMVSRGGLTVFCLSRHCACSKKILTLVRHKKPPIN